MSSEIGPSAANFGSLFPILRTPIITRPKQRLPKASALGRVGWMMLLGSYD
jgi:hypothetical protein